MKILLKLLLVLVCCFGAAFYLSASGWGYIGYYGFHSGPSMFYRGGPKYVHTSKSVREGSVGGPGHRGGGARGGK
jgi:hypothetical protein